MLCQAIIKASSSTAYLSNNDHYIALAITLLLLLSQVPVEDRN